MITKESFSKLKRVNITIWVKEKNLFRDGKNSKRICVYDTNPDMVLSIITKALAAESEI